MNKTVTLPLEQATAGQHDDGLPTALRLYKSIFVIKSNKNRPSK